MARSIQVRIAFMKDAQEFLDNLDETSRDKIMYNVNKIAGGFIDKELFKKLDGVDGFWELRTIYNGMQYRLMAFWDETEKRLVVATHGFVKKTWKIPAKEIARAVQLRRKYYESK